MPQIDKVRVRLQAILTYLFLRVLRRSKLKEKRELRYLEEPITVFVFESNSPIFAQATPFSTILWNDTRIEGLSNQAKEFILRHERSHRDRNSVYKGLLYGMAVWCASGIVLLLFAGLFLVLGTSLSSLQLPLAVAVVLIIPFFILFRVEETVADYHVIQELGEEDFIEAYAEVAANSDNSLTAQIFTRFLYTKPEDTIRLYHALQNSSISAK